MTSYKSETAIDRIVKIETYRWEEQSNILWVEITTENGLVGLGETFYIPGAVESVIHDMAAPLLLDKNAFDIENHWNTLFCCANFYGYAGAEMRAFSAIDIALWDILGQATGMPIYQLLGGKCRDRIRIYNTCINAYKYKDMDDSFERPGELAQNLLDQGITAMKIWPWDRFAPQIQSKALTGPAGWAAMGPAGSYLSLEDLKKGLWVVEDIRKKVGDRMEILIEGHSRWDLNCAIKIGRALEPYEIFWLEDIMQPESPSDLARLSDSIRVPLSISERLFTRYGFRQILEAKAAHVVMMDVVWTGGITEAKKIATLADTYHLSVAPHDGTGPVTIFSGLHICANASNAMMMETERAYYDGGYYSECVTNILTISNGHVEFPTTPGLGTALREDFKARKDVSSRVSVGQDSVCL
ncbi:mandelate racemase/muconate lactonizing enzyme family protein [Cohnella soli]|uniref:Mandelate racemase/muconate lactonizing enzyme family protein n=1 Tax=Cohnella soli TaxID=425005 RepID=A0ABW0HSV6_9BACL